jgi:DNA-directed RNA polymerase subunit RPC12/RpoP
MKIKPSLAKCKRCKEKLAKKTHNTVGNETTVTCYYCGYRVITKNNAITEVSDTAAVVRYRRTGDEAISIGFVSDQEEVQRMWEYLIQASSEGLVDPDSVQISEWNAATNTVDITLCPHKLAELAKGKEDAHLSIARDCQE